MSQPGLTHALFPLRNAWRVAGGCSALCVRAVHGSPGLWRRVIATPATEDHHAQPSHTQSTAATFMSCAGAPGHDRYDNRETAAVAAAA